MIDHLSGTHPCRLREAARYVRQGGIIAYPTEAIFGLGCDPLNWQAVRRLLILKKRPVEKGLILIAANINQLLPFIKPLPEEIMQPILASWPGPNTWLFPAADNLPYWLCGKYNTLAVRVTAHPIAAQLCLACNSPLVSTSANITARKPALSALQVRSKLNGKVDFILSGATGPAHRPSVIRNALNGVVIRE